MEGRLTLTENTRQYKNTAKNVITGQSISIIKELKVGAKTATVFEIK